MMLSAKATASLLILLGVVGIALVNATEVHAQMRPPNPVLVFLGTEYYQAGGKSFVRYKYAIDNRVAYPDSMFAAAPALPPCGNNTKASRTWVDFYQMNGKRLYGFCALRKHDDLTEIWFALEEGILPPSWIYVEFTDRQSGEKYKSNLADTTL